MQKAAGVTDWAPNVRSGVERSHGHKGWPVLPKRGKYSWNGSSRSYFYSRAFNADKQRFVKPLDRPGRVDGGKVIAVVDPSREPPAW
ncbi:MAG TPA: hypothetical protein VJ617_12330, partial [Arthrobacter sp.]|nr:hypothetical protein [Arthrobacter sp.]